MRKGHAEILVTRNGAFTILLVRSKIKTKEADFVQSYRIGVLKGDGIGPEIVQASMCILEATAVTVS